MNDDRIGPTLRAIRHRKGLTQAEVGRLSGVAQSAVSLIERGHWQHLSVRALRNVFGAVDARIDVNVLWRGADLERLLDERHAALVGQVVEILRSDGWRVEVEVSFSHFGERGSIDILAAHAATRTILVIEVKTVLASVEESLRRLDVKERLAGGIALDRFGWRPASVSKCLVLLDGRTARRRVAEHASVLDAALPARGHLIRGWLRRPSQRLAGLWILANSFPAAGSRHSGSRKRVRQPRRTA